MPMKRKQGIAIYPFFFLLVVGLLKQCEGWVPSTKFRNSVQISTELYGHDPKRRALFPVLLSFPASAWAKDLGEEYRQGTAALANMDDAAPVPQDAYKKLPSGVVYADLRPGSGTETAQQGSRVNLQWVLRRSNGYFVDSSERNDGVPFIFEVGDGKAIQGIDEGVRGMKVGGVRRILIPPSLAYVEGLEDGKPGPLPAGFGPRQQMRRVMNVRKDVPGEYVFLEVQLTRLR
jgi:hypothetical protein